MDRYCSISLLKDKSKQRKRSYLYKGCVILICFAILVNISIIFHHYVNIILQHELVPERFSLSQCIETTAIPCCK